jgi:hypothetical protein
MKFSRVLQERSRLEVVEEVGEVAVVVGLEVREVKVSPGGQKQRTVTAHSSDIARTNSGYNDY